MGFRLSVLSWVLLLAFNSTAAQSNDAPKLVARAVPSGFEDIFLGQTEQVEVSLFGQSLGLFEIHVKPDTVQFIDPDALITALGLDESEKTKLAATIRSAVDAQMPRRGHLACSASSSSTCNYVETDSVAVIFDDAESKLTLFLATQWIEQLPNLKRGSARYHAISGRAQNAFVHAQSARWSVGTRQQRNLSLAGSGALGLTERGYLGGEWQFDASTERRQSRQNFDVNTLYVRQDMGDRHYGQLGRLDQRNLASTVGGSFSFNFLPLPRFDGVRVGTTRAYANASLASNATPVTVLLTAPARVDVYRGQQLLGTQYFAAGIENLNTASLPEGNYELQLRIFEAGVLTRTEDIPFSKTGSAMDTDDTQWFLQGGQIVPGDRIQYARSQPSVQAGFKTGLFNRVLLTSGVSAVSGSFSSETRLDWQQPILNGTLDVSAAYFLGTDGTRGNSQSLSYRNSVGMSIVRNQIRAPEHLSARRSLTNRGSYDSVYASVYMPVGKWSANLGVNYSKSKGRHVAQGAFGQDGSWDDTGRDFYSRRSQDHVSRAVQLGVSRSFRWQGMQFNTRMGGYQSQSVRDRRDVDRGVYAGVSISLAKSDASSGRSGFTSAGANVRTSRSGRTQMDYNAGQSWTWQNGTYRDLSVNVGGYRTDRFQGLVQGQVAGRAGTLNGAVSHAYDVDSGEQSSAFTGGYSSSLAIARSGVYWGGDGGARDPGAALAIHVQDKEDEPADAVAEVVGGGARGVSLGFGQRAMIPAGAYQAGQIEIRDATSANSQGVVNLSQGSGTRSYFLPPGKLLAHEVAANVTYTYVGRALSTDGTPLAGAKVLNVAAAEMDDEGGFILDADTRLQVLYVLKDQDLLQCPMLGVGKRAVVQHVGETSCQPIEVTALPQALRKQPRVSRLLQPRIAVPLAGVSPVVGSADAHNNKLGG